MRRLGALATAFAVAALTIVLSAQPASADANFVVGMPDAVATSAGGTVETCGASGYASTYVYPEGDAAIIFGGSTSCTRAMKMNGTAAITPTPGSIPVASNTFTKILSLSGTAYGIYVTVPGANFALTHTTSIWAPIGFSWTSVPPHCTVSGSKLTCTMITFFSVV
ncbi:hypothetical protein Rhe02_97010 [Rhizocola hellebori]|uniref:Secreted protein n=1 Tax=Rhizocola hellebori TaxID=1392758 RepID=A0A8J3VLR0_9ACTN|nr:hypothetical protein [Rhizocola hellebori]GIH11634.1 hypothetical protein Rhe02_97010 [Rhizocola hellebori]